MGSLQGDNPTLTPLNIISHMTASHQSIKSCGWRDTEMCATKDVGEKKAKAGTPSENMLRFERKDRRLINYISVRLDIWAEKDSGTCCHSGKDNNDNNSSLKVSDIEVIR